MNHLQKFIHDHLDILQVSGAGTGGTVLLLTDIDMWLKIFIAMSTLGYILRKWYLMEKKNGNKKNN